jgi:hypothetical protein
MMNCLNDFILPEIMQHSCIINSGMILNFYNKYIQKRSVPLFYRHLLFGIIRKQGVYDIQRGN